MIPYSYNMVDMDGIDLAEANGTVVPGIYERITEAMNLCGDVIFYNWKFAEINIVPSACTVLQQTNSILINGLIQVTEQDEITVLAIDPPPAPVVPLVVNENGVYEIAPPQSGYNPVTVVVPPPVISPLSINANGEYSAPPGIAGYNPIAVNVSGGNPVAILKINTIITAVDGVAIKGLNVVPAIAHEDALLFGLPEYGEWAINITTQSEEVVSLNILVSQEYQEYTEAIVATIAELKAALANTTYARLSNTVGDGASFGGRWFERTENSPIIFVNGEYDYRYRTYCVIKFDNIVPPETYNSYGDLQNVGTFMVDGITCYPFFMTGAMPNPVSGISYTLDGVSGNVLSDICVSGTQPPILKDHSYELSAYIKALYRLLNGGNNT